MLPILAACLTVLLLAMILTGFLKFGDDFDMETIAPIQVFKIDNIYSIHFRGIGGVCFQTWFAIVFITASGDTATRLFGWERRLTYTES